jgi:hypothetical protein
MTMKPAATAMAGRPEMLRFMSLLPEVLPACMLAEADYANEAFGAMKAHWRT